MSNSQLDPFCADCQHEAGLQHYVRVHSGVKELPEKRAATKSEET
jgi:hypothetical protein